MLINIHNEIKSKFRSRCKIKKENSNKYVKECNKNYRKVDNNKSKNNKSEKNKSKIKNNSNKNKRTHLNFQMKTIMTLTKIHHKCYKDYLNK